MISSRSSCYLTLLISDAFCKKTYTFNLDDNSFFCIIIHIISLTFDDETFEVSDLISSKQLFWFRVSQNKSYQFISWKNEMLDILIFHWVIVIKQDVWMSSDKSLIYIQYYSWIQWLNEVLDYLQILITYCLWQILNNVINDRVFS